MATDATHLQGDDRVARAIDQVLAAERTAQAAILQCENATTAALEHARQQRRACLERAQARIAVLRARVAHSLELRTTQLAEQRRQSAAATVIELSDASKQAAAIERLAALLTGSD
jgi:hypothetical protein